jgi:hypothetical protein
MASGLAASYLAWMKSPDAQTPAEPRFMAAAAERDLSPGEGASSVGIAPARGATLQAFIDRSPRMQAQRHRMNAMSTGLAALPAAATTAVPVGVPQRKTPIALVTEVATSDISRSLLYQLVVEHGLTQYTQILERGVLGLLDYFVTSDLVSGFVPSLKNLLGMLTPYLGAIQAVRNIFRALPEAVQKVAVYLMGRGLMHASKGYLGGFVTEAWVNKLLVGPDWGASLDEIVSWTTWMQEQLDSISRWPLTRLYELSWSAVSRLTGSGSKSWGTMVVEKSLGIEAPGRTLAPSTDDGDGDGDGGKERGETAQSLVRADLKYIWLEIDQPRLARWRDGEGSGSDVSTGPEEQRVPRGSGEERGGLELPFQFGMALFGASLETTKEQVLRLPWSGGFELNLGALEIKVPNSLAPTFSVRALMLDRVKVTQEGLQSFSVSLHDMSFAEGAVMMPVVSAEWDKGRGLAFRGEMTTRVLDKRIEGEAMLGLDPDGKFDRGSLAVKAVDDIPVIPGALVLAGAGFAGGVNRQGDIDISVFGGVHSEFSIFVLDVTRAHIDYHKGDGHEFKGGVEKLVLRIGDGIVLTVEEAVIQRGSLHIAEASLVYEHDPQRPERQADALQALSFPTGFLDFIGLQSLRIGGKVRDIRIVAGRVTASSTTVENARSSGQESGVEGDDRSSTSETPRVPGFSVGSVAPVLSKLGVRVLGVGAEVDLEQGIGKVAGEIKVAPTIPSLDVEFPILPQLALMGHASLTATAAIGAALDGTLRKGTGSPEIPFHLGSTARLSGDLAVMAKVGVHLGSHFLASIGASLFAEAKASLGAEVGLKGVLYVDPEHRTLRLGDGQDDAVRAHYLLKAGLEASIGVTGEVRAFYFFQGELFRYTFKTWRLGDYVLEGDIKGMQDGEHEVDHRRGEFKSRDGKPHAPELEVTAVVDARRFLMEQGLEIPGSGPAREQLIRELIERYRAADKPVAKALQTAAERAAELKHEFVAFKMNLATQGRSLTEEEFRQYEAGQETVAHAHETLQRLQADYREVQLVLVDAKSAVKHVQELSGGAFDIAGLEERIRAVGEGREARKGELETAREELGSAERVLKK